MRITLPESILLFLFLWSALSGKAQTTYTTIGIIGSSTLKGWYASTPMKPAGGNDSHQWQVTLPLVKGEVKFRANNSWDVNWGNSPFPLGIAVEGGANIQVPVAGSYEVTFNDMTGDYSFAAISYAVPRKKKLEKRLTGQETSGGSIFPAEAKIREIFSNGEDFLEGPAMSPDGLLYFSDFSEQTKTGIIWTLNPETGAYKVFRSPSGMANGLAFDANGDFIVCEQAGGGGRRVTKTDMKTGITKIIAGQYRNKSFNSPNDLSIDAQGRIYFTDPSYPANDVVEQNAMGIYRIDKDNSVHLVAANFAFDLNEDGSLQFRSKLIDFGNSIAPDGMTVDAEGSLYIAVGNRVVVYDSNGTKLSEVKCPQATNLCFGRGRYRKTLFIAGGKSIYMVETNKDSINE